MLKFDPAAKTITETHGGLSDAGMPIRDTYVKLAGWLNHQRGMLYEPVEPCEKSEIAIINVHSDSDYLDFPIAAEMAKRGYRSFGGQVSGNTLDEKLLDIKRIVEFLRSIPGVKKVILMGHSGGATLMTAYQNAAENGIQVLKSDNLIYKCTLSDDEVLPPADGMLLLDANWGNCAMTLFSIDPAIVEEGNGMKLDPALDTFNPENGFDPAGAHYPKEFLDKFFAAQAERNNRIVDMALERLRAIEAGEGMFQDDEPFVVAGAAQFAPCNKLFPQDLSLIAHTKAEHDLIHADGSVTHEIVRSLRGPKFSQSITPMNMATVQTTVRCFLSERAVYAKPDYYFYADGVEGVDWDNVYCSAVPNVRKIHAPLLCMGMTGGYEFLASEVIYDNAASEDKHIAFVEGATHNFSPEHEVEKFPGQFGDTEKLVYDYVDQWLSAEGRFLGK